MIRTWLGNWFIKRGRKLGRSDSAEIAVTLSEHSINTTMVRPDKEEQAWDPDHYRHGCVFYAGYANPIKPIVNVTGELDDPDTARLTASAGEEAEEEDGEAEAQGELISSVRYRDYMRQDLISQLLNPREQWRLIAYGIIALCILIILNMALSASAAGLL